MLELLTSLAPTPEVPAGIDPNDVTPGLAGFLATFFLAVAVILLSMSMVRRVRRIRHRAELEARREVEEAAQRARSDGPEADGDGSPGRAPELG